ncbi:MAG: DUF6020 family protein [Streptosporangiaceae bacterium]|jgi:hypothetical protein
MPHPESGVGRPSPETGDADEADETVQLARSGEPGRGRGHRFLLPLATYAVCQLIFLFWWGAFYPGLMNRDSIIYMQHVTTGPWVANHSVLYDSMVLLSLRWTGDLGALTLFQTIAMSAALAYTVAAFRRLGVPGWATAVAAVIVAALPPTGSFIIFIWKDVPFAICACLVVPTTAHLISLRGGPRWQRDRRVTGLIAALFLELLGVCLFRQDGFLVAGVAAVALAALIGRVRIRVTAVAAVAIGLTFLLKIVVYPAVGILPADSSLTYGPAWADIAVAYAKSPSSFSTADKDLLKRVAPLAEWKDSADCYDADSTDYARNLTKRALRQTGPLFSLWLQLLRRHPGLIIGARLCRGAIAWVAFPSPAAVAGDYLSEIPYSMFAARNEPGVKDMPARYYADIATRPLWGFSLAYSLRNGSESNSIAWLLWRGATWCYIAYLAIGILAVRRRDWKILALAAVILANQLVVMADSPTQVFRYMAAPLLIGPMTLALLFARTRPAAGPTAATGPEPGGGSQPEAGFRE